MKKIIFLCMILMTSFNCNAQVLKKLTVMLDWFPNPDHAPLIVAAENGFFEEEGLSVNLIGPADPNDPPKLVAAGKADIGLTYEPEFMQQIDRGLPLIRIGTLIDKPLDCIIALKSSHITSIADLKGKQIGSSSSGLASMMLKSMLTHAGIDEKEVTLINVRYNLTQALLLKKVSAVTGIMRNFEIPQLESRGQEVVAFFPEEHGIPNYSVLIFIANVSHQHDTRFPHFLRAIKKAVAYIDQHPEKSWAMFAKKYPESNNDINRQAWFNTMPYFAEDPASFDPEEWQQFAEFMFNEHMIRKIQPLSHYAVELS